MSEDGHPQGLEFARGFALQIVARVTMHATSTSNFQPLALHRQSSTLLVRQSQSAAHEPRFKNLISTRKCIGSFLDTAGYSAIRLRP